MTLLLRIRLHSVPAPSCLVKLRGHCGLARVAKFDAFAAQSDSSLFATHYTVAASMGSTTPLRQSGRSNSAAAPQIYAMLCFVRSTEYLHTMYPLSPIYIPSKPSTSIVGRPTKGNLAQSQQ